MLPGRLQRNASIAQLREGELVLVQDGNTNAYFVCTVHSFCDSNEIQFDRSVRLSIVDSKPTMESPIMPQTPSPPPLTPSPTPTTTPKPSPFSFKEFTSALKDTANTPIKSQQRSSLSSLPSTAKRPAPPDLTRMKRVQAANFNLLIPSQQLSIPAASSVSLEIPEGIEFTPATRRRIQSWFVGMIFSEGCEVSSILLSREFTCTVRRTVPASATYCRVVPDTRLVFEPKPALQQEQQPRPSMMLLPNDPFMYKGMVLRGPSGTGKRYTVDSFVRAQVNVDFIQCSLRDETEVNKALNYVAKQHKLQRCVLSLLDGETQHAFASKTNNRKLAHLLDSCANLLVFLLINDNDSGGNNADAASIPTYLTRSGRLEREVIFALPNSEQREQFMLDLQCNDVAAQFARDYCVGYSQRDLLQLLSRTKDNSNCTLQALQQAQLGLGKQRFAKIDSNRLAVHQVGGQLEAKKALAMAVEWPFTRKQELQKFGLDVLFRGILLYGPAGCAKTTMVREVARRNAGNASFYALSGADVYSSGFGDAEAKVRSVFAQARATAPSILFFDEIDSLVGNRGLGAPSSGGDSVQSRVLSTFLNEMDGVDTSLGDTVVVIGATNCPQNLDRALLRPGRFDRVIFVGPPSPESVLEIELDRMQISTVVNIATLAREAEHMSGADIAGACRLAAVQAVSAGREEPTEADIVLALRLATRSCKPEVLEKFMQWNVGDN